MNYVQQKTISVKTNWKISYVIQRVYLMQFLLSEDMGEFLGKAGYTVPNMGIRPNIEAEN